MAIERTFSIIKPDVTRRNLTGRVNAKIEEAGLRVIAQKRVLMTRAQAETFYAVHKSRPFFGELVEQMTAGPVVVQVLEGENAIKAYRDVMGAIPPRRKPARSARNLRSTWAKILSTARTRRKRPRSKSRNGSPATRSWAEHFCRPVATCGEVSLLFFFAEAVCHERGDCVERCLRVGSACGDRDGHSRACAERQNAHDRGAPDRFAASRNLNLGIERFGALHEFRGGARM
jgi:nucleoside-diphosphate kinase